MARTNTIFEGVATALITPMTENGVNYDQLGRLIDWQIDEGIDALVICGTTGEGSTLTDAEHKECIRYAVERANHRVPVIAGTGSNDTAYGVELTRFASDAGADACLIVTSYYNKATQKGLVKLFTEYANASDVPIIAYNVPSRTGLNIEPDTYVELAKIDKVTAIKEANSNISKIVQTFAKLNGALDVYSGNDDQIVPIMAMGGKGVISVLSNVIPAETKEICTRFFNGDVAGAAALQCKYSELISALFCEVNPIPVKEAMAMLGFCDPILRSPLYRMEPQNLERLTRAMTELGII
ncbi:MAG: 4-hydroxy-tetrahydrodipicolinate synthase [Mogibacterium sp.]|nr:4-hydroxy-tetrahydrodipicolinate synthase [Eggerthellaceae bacterium]MBR0374648.1 4-hydroxy-tetrahydrodipicolinate synthase [Mogibacterium sp.]